MKPSSIRQNPGTNMANKQPAVQLKQFFQRNGYVRMADKKRINELGRQRYKKGYEVRLVATNEDELVEIRRLLEQLGFKPGKPFQKKRQIIQPIYGKEAVEWFLSTKLK
jgi:uncharacterized membrane protein affecting hemolysin expression